jgi:hypothetical protein
MSAIYDFPLSISNILKNRNKNEQGFQNACLFLKKPIILFSRNSGEVGEMEFPLSQKTETIFLPHCQKYQ